MTNANAFTLALAAYVTDTCERGAGATFAERFVSGASQDDADRERSTELMREVGALGDEDAEEGVRAATQAIWKRACGKTSDSVAALIDGIA